MLLHQIQRKKPKEILPDDSTIAKIALLIAPQYIMETDLAFELKTYRVLFFKANELQYVSLMLKTFDKQSDDFKIFKDIQEVMHLYNKQKSHQKHNIGVYNKRMNWLRVVKKSQKMQYEKSIYEKKAMELFPFLGKDIFWAEMTKTFLESKSTEDPYIKFILETFTKFNNMPLLTMNMNDSGSSSSWELWKNKTETDNLPEFLSCLLFRFPDVSGLSYEQLNYTRENLLKKLSQFNKQVDDLHEAVSELSYEAQHWEKLRNLLDEKLNSSSDLQQKLESELYIQYAKNAGGTKSFDVYVGITSLEVLANYHEKKGTLNAYSANTLRERLNLEEKHNRAIIFYNIQVSDTATTSVGQ